jgi:hypothetical protein
LLKERGLSFQQLTDELHIHRTNLNTSLAGNPTLIRLVDFANVHKVDGTDLFSNKQASKQNKINGFVEYVEKVYRINSIDDLEYLIEIIK